MGKEEIISLLIPLGIGFISGLISMGGIKNFNSLIKPFKGEDDIELSIATLIVKQAILL